MEKFSFVVKDELGLHARPAGLLVKCAQACSSNISISKDGKLADAKRLFAIMGLGVKQNDEITFSVEGLDENTDSVKLKAFCEANL
jgi:phosphocarrier protein HPr